MKLDTLAVVVGSVVYVAVLRFFSVGGELSPTAHGVAFLGMLVLGGIALITTRALRRDLRELGGGEQ